MNTETSERLPVGDRPAPEVLFVDDEAGVRRAIVRVFMDEDYAVHTAASGDEGLQILKENEAIGVVVSDQRMPGLSGVEFLARSREIRPELIRILLTAYCEVQASVDAINHGGAHRYLTKPWQDDDLVSTVREAREHYALAEENRRLNRIVSEQNEQLKQWNGQLEHMVQVQTMELQDQNRALSTLNERLRGNFRGVIGSLAGLIELRDPWARSHSRNVAELALRCALVMKLPPQETEAIMAAALLHDIGKIGIPDAMLAKDVEEMSTEEFAEYRQHPVRGQTAVDAIADLRSAGILIRHHHERFGGGGFPDGLAGEEIPLGARLIALADFIDRHLSRLGGETAQARVMDMVRNDPEQRFDVRLLERMMVVATSYYTRGEPASDVVEWELLPEDLRPGMMLSRDAKSGTGLLLVGRGRSLDDKTIERLRRLQRQDPRGHGVFVWLKR